MRKVKYGRFVDFMPPKWDPDDLIGAHIYVRHAEQESLKTAGYEYYIIDNGRYKTIDDATAIEKIRARFMFLFEPKKKKVIGVRSKVIVNPYSDPNPQLGVKLDDNGKKVVDKSYYESHEQRVMENQKKSENEKKEDLQRIKTTLEAAKQMLEEKNVEDESTKIRHR